ncbi:MAG: hypothetical protein RLZZ628_4068 [Bacteroidota bacterium]|jgi:hypothetical protein
MPTKKLNIKQISGVVTNIIPIGNTPVTAANAAADSLTFSMPKRTGEVVHLVLPYFNGNAEFDLIPPAANITEDATTTTIKITGFASGFVAGADNNINLLIFYKVV